MGILYNTKEKIHTLEIFPRTLMEETLQPQPNTGIERETIHYLETRKLVKGVEFIQKRVFHTVQKRRQRKEIVKKTDCLPVLELKRGENSIHREVERRIKRKHNRINTSRAGQMVQSNVYNSETSLEMEENSGCECTEQGNTNDSFQDEWNRSNERFDKERRLGNMSRSQVGLSPPNIWNTALPNLLHTSTSNGSNEDTERVRYKNSELRRRSAPPTLEQRKIAKINLDNNENFGSIWLDNSSREMRNRTETTDQLPRMDVGLGKDVHKDDRPKETGTTLLIKEIYQPNIETNSDQDKISSINNRQVEFFLRVQVREASLYLKLMDSAKTRALKNKEWRENMILSKEILQELYW
ncbi:MAG: hypothetical protein EZS28_023369 [Streblomastix strix]|uniref:Uncharacterized protein n=1 Tax=Streblomastix strix TaxID=222440 RepID=A0A5J4VEX3_9EUKA|nr:MAG: hypothetical protein EZS28_023369 [Streblomastix strix]